MRISALPFNNPPKESNRTKSRRKKKRSKSKVKKSLQIVDAPKPILTLESKVVKKKVIGKPKDSVLQKRKRSEVEPSQSKETKVTEVKVVKKVKKGKKR